MYVSMVLMMLLMRREVLVLLLQMYESRQRGRSRQRRPDRLYRRALEFFLLFLDSWDEELTGKYDARLTRVGFLCPRMRNRTWL
jgi:hypothetical protein